jgi:hypothetical protein
MVTVAQVHAVAAGGASATTVAWFTLAGALGGVLITGVVSLATLTLNHRWQARGADRQRLQDHNTLVRQERRDSYAAYWLAWNQFIHDLRRLQDQVRELPPGAVANQSPAPGLQADVARQLQEVIDKAWDAELQWRAAADALMLVADPQVEQAAKAHVALTEQKLAAAWQGQSHRDENGTAYTALNNAMRAALLTAVRPEAWDPTSWATR